MTRKRKVEIKQMDFLKDEIISYKIDVEGYESEVIDGAQEILSKKFEAVIIELRGIEGKI